MYKLKLASSINVFVFFLQTRFDKYSAHLHFLSLSIGTVIGRNVEMLNAKAGENQSHHLVTVNLND